MGHGDPAPLSGKGLLKSLPPEDPSGFLQPQTVPCGIVPHSGPDHRKGDAKAPAQVPAVSLVPEGRLPQAVIYVDRFQGKAHLLPEREKDMEKADRIRPSREAD